jgi:glycerol-3-phosphate dehydrogenase
MAELVRREERASDCEEPLVRGEVLERMAGEPFDLVVIGGGVTGSGVALDAALRGLRVCLVEAGDVAQGTSSRSSRLLHGGLRYLEHYEFGLVHEACSERRLLGRLAPYLSTPLPFVFPVYRGDSTGWWMIKAGMVLYDVLAMFRNYRRHRGYGAAALAALEPGLRREGLRGGFVYYDVRTDDARLALAVLLTARERGALAANYLRAIGFERRAGRVVGVAVRDELEGGEFVIRARRVVDATGPWSDRVRAMDPAAPQGVLRPTKGVHIVLRREDLPVAHAVVMRHEGRVLFAIPWGEFTYVGTTDTDYEGSLEELHATREDVDYLFGVLRRFFPGRVFRDELVVSTWAGVRPLIDPRRGLSAGEVSREHKVFESSSGLFSICGGKLTTYRVMAAEVVDRVVESLGRDLPPGVRRRSETSRTVLVGGELGDPLVDLPPELVQAEGLRDLPRAQQEHLYRTYGSRARAVRALAEREPELAELLDPELPIVLAEVVHAVRFELAQRLADVLIRRLPVIYKSRDQGLSCAARAASLMARELGWSAERTAAELAAYRREVALSRRFRGESAAQSAA